MTQDKQDKNKLSRRQLLKRTGIGAMGIGVAAGQRETTFIEEAEKQGLPSPAESSRNSAVVRGPRGSGYRQTISFRPSELIGAAGAASLAAGAIDSSTRLTRRELGQELKSTFGYALAAMYAGQGVGQIAGHGAIEAAKRSEALLPKNPQSSPPEPQPTTRAQHSERSRVRETSDSRGR